MEIRLHAAAPDKPPFGAPCNGCGACCAAAPCPLSRFLLGHRSGACPALAWHEDQHRYLCGMVTTPEAMLRHLPRMLAGTFAQLARRWIGAGHGCDFDAALA